MPAYRQLNLVDLLEAFSSGSPVPGGGSAAALAGTVAVSLLMMVARVPRTRTGASIEEIGLEDAASRLLPLREALMQLVDRDAAAYDQVLTASRSVRHSGAESTRRAVDPVLLEATSTQMDVLRNCRDALRVAQPVLTHGARSAIADMRVATELLQAAARGAAATVDANIGLIGDADARQAIEAERHRLDEEISGMLDGARRTLL
jgi:formiminotetrahydrofolate cyclodeaminase